MTRRARKRPRWQATQIRVFSTTLMAGAFALSLGPSLFAEVVESAAAGFTSLEDFVQADSSSGDQVRAVAD